MTDLAISDTAPPRTVALFMTCLNFGNMAGSASLGWLDSLGGIPAMFIAVAVCSLTAGAFALAAKVWR